MVVSDYILNEWVIISIISTISIDRRKGMITGFVKQMGIPIRKASNSKGGIFHSGCPKCGGIDRFTIWQGKGRYWCRGCNCSGNAVQFLHDFLGVPYSEARKKIGYSPLDQFYTYDSKRSFSSFYVSVGPPPPAVWKRKVSVLTGEHLNQRLLDDLRALKPLYKRGLKHGTIEKHRLGYLGSDIYLNKEEWGIERDGKKLWIPKGHIIPFYGKDHFPFRVKIRKEETKRGKYHHLLGGATNWIAVYGKQDQSIVMLVESEFDAMLVVQEAGEHCCCVALGGASHRPDLATYIWLKKKESILFAFDFDEAGKKAFPKWKKVFPNLIPFPVPKGKSPEEAYTGYGIDLSQWIQKGLKAPPIQV